MDLLLFNVLPNEKSMITNKQSQNFDDKKMNLLKLFNGFKLLSPS